MESSCWIAKRAHLLYSTLEDIKKVRIAVKQRADVYRETESKLGNSEAVSFLNLSKRLMREEEQVMKELKLYASSCPLYLKVSELQLGLKFWSWFLSRCLRFTSYPSLKGFLGVRVSPSGKRYKTAAGKEASTFRVMWNYDKDKWFWREAEKRKMELKAKHPEWTPIMVHRKAWYKTFFDRILKEIFEAKQRQCPGCIQKVKG